ncbi:hypothetical protein BaRGS_00031413 [Batillaria attramentaria]|uniref:Secreted protein n=1 Tax=Batillaria attramentaria TaxID=370345 RepID=A0ABD0JR63_9CAEN
MRYALKSSSQFMVLLYFHVSSRPVNSHTCLLCPPFSRPPTCYKSAPIPPPPRFAVSSCPRELPFLLLSCQATRTSDLLDSFGREALRHTRSTVMSSLVWD